MYVEIGTVLSTVQYSTTPYRPSLNPTVSASVLWSWRLHHTRTDDVWWSQVLHLISTDLNIFLILTLWLFDSNLIHTLSFATVSSFTEFFNRCCFCLQWVVCVCVNTGKCVRACCGEVGLGGCVFFFPFSSKFWTSSLFPLSLDRSLALGPYSLRSITDFDWLVVIG